MAASSVSTSRPITARPSGGGRAGAQLGDSLQPEAANRGNIVAEPRQLQPQPARDLRAAGIREPRQLGEIADGHDAGNDGNTDADGFAVVDETQVGVGVEEILCNCGIRAGVQLALEVPDVVLRAPRLRVELRIAGHLDVEVAAGALADELDEFARIAKLARARRAGWQVAAQR